MSELTAEDCRIVGSFPNAPANSWTDLLTQADRDAFIRVHRTLADIAAALVDRVGPPYRAVLTAGFHEKSGTRNTRPKDLWCAIVHENSKDFVGMPQLFIIASGRGVELGFAPAIHPSDFSAAEVKKRLREVVPTLFSLFPHSNDRVVTQLQQELSSAGSWHYRSKARVPPKQQEFPSLTALIDDLHSPDGMRRGAASVSRYFSLDELNDPSLSLAEELQRAFALFQPLIDVVSGRYSLGKGLLEREELLRDVLGPARADETAPQDLVDARRKILATITQRQGQGPFRSDLLVAYRGSCAVTGTTAIEALEAAHIKPYAGPQTNKVNNGLLLRADIHTLFDLGLLTIADDLSVIVSNKLADPVYQALHGKRITLPTEENARPSLDAIRWHRSNRLGQST